MACAAARRRAPNLGSSLSHSMSPGLRAAIALGLIFPAREPICPPAGYHPATTLMRFGEVTRRVLIACPRDFAALLKLLMSCYAPKYRICNQGVVGSNPAAGTSEFNELSRR